MPSPNITSADHLKNGRGLAHHKLGPGVVALHSSAFQEMDDYAPYRIAFLLLLIVSSVVLWASYKLICERVETEEDGTGGPTAVYQPLSQPTDGDAWMADFGEEEEEDGSLCSLEMDAFLGK